jgi:hypothetical protein
VFALKWNTYTYHPHIVKTSNIACYHLTVLVKKILQFIIFYLANKQHAINQLLSNEFKGHFIDTTVKQFNFVDSNDSYHTLKYSIDVYLMDLIVMLPSPIP